MQIVNPQAGVANPQNLVPLDAPREVPTAPVEPERKLVLFPKASAETHYRTHKLGFLSQYRFRYSEELANEIATNLKTLYARNDGQEDPASLQALTQLTKEALQDNGFRSLANGLRSSDTPVDDEVRALMRENRPPLADATAASSVCEQQLGSSLSLARLFDTSRWPEKRLLDLHTLAFYEMTPPGELTSQIRRWFKATCERVRYQAIRAGEPGNSRCMMDFNERMARIADGIKVAELQAQEGAVRRTGEPESKRVRQAVIQSTPPTSKSTSTSGTPWPVIAFPVVTLEALPSGNPAASQRLAAAYADLHRAMQRPPQVQSGRALADGLRRVFQELASMALAEDRMDAYQEAEAAALSWMHQARNAAQGALAPGRALQDCLFDLLSDAPEDLILAMRARGISLAIDCNAPEGGEIETFI